MARAEWTALARDAEAVLGRPREGLAGAVPDLDRVEALERELPVAAQGLEQIVERLRARARHITPRRWWRSGGWRSGRRPPSSCPS